MAVASGKSQEAASTGLSPVWIHLDRHDDVYRLNALGVSIEGLEGGRADARISQAKMEELGALGWRVEPRKEEGPDPKVVSAYHDYDWLTAKLDSLCAQHPAITRKYSMGLSQQSRHQWAFVVTDNPDSDENEAEVRFTATIHGNEPVGTEMCLALMDSLVQGYQAGTPEITELVNSREIWFVPMYNPDGNTLVQRGLANGVDPNRNFPVPDGTVGDDGTYTNYVETRNFMEFWSTKRAVLSATFHGGALVANYPWDYTITRCPDDELAREAALGYSRLNPTMYASASFDSGVTNGYDWYEVNGSLQDWSYHATSCLDITLELGLNKWPPASALPGYWEDNREAMLYFIRQSGWGLQGKVSDSLTGLPINWASMVPFGIDKPVYTDTIGDYHRMLMTGWYDLSYSAVGYHQKWASDIRVRLDSLTHLDMPLAPILVSGTVSDSGSGQPVPGALVEIVGLRSDTTDSAGNYLLRWNQDDHYRLRASAAGYRTVIYDSLKFDCDSTINFSLVVDTGHAGRPDPLTLITRLEHPYPSPGPGPVNIRFQLAAAGEAGLDIYDVTGRLIKRLPQGRVPAGTVRSVSWDGLGQGGLRVPAGVYLCRLSAPGAVRTARFVLLQ
jgi:predicted deacylase